MVDYEDAFQAENLRVQNTSRYLFDCPVVESVFEVCDWLTDPASPERTAELVTEANLGLDSLENLFEAHGWCLDAILSGDTSEQDLNNSHRRLLTGLRRLRDDHDSFQMRPAGTYIEDIIKALALRADPYDCFPASDPSQRVANLDSLTETITQWEGDDRYSPHKLIELVEPYRIDPSDGPRQPSTTGLEYDVRFQTVHRSKGSQDDVVVLADPGAAIWSRGPHTQRLVAQGDVVGFAPPTNTDTPTDIHLPPFDGGLYDPDAGYRRDVGLRWVTVQWSNTISETANRSSLIGPSRLQQVAANARAEAWRLLYVALTRAQDYLVIPLPKRKFVDNCPRDRWSDTIKAELQFNESRTQNYQLTE
jgi:ATP-dependent helicase/nuclease subunit A